MKGNAKWRKWWIYGGIGVMLLIFVLPTMLLHTPLRAWVIGGALAREGIDLQIGDIRAGWFTPLRLRDTRMGPLGRRHVISIDEIRSDRTLLSALFEGIEVGELTVRHPQIHVWIDNGGSNLEFPALEGIRPSSEQPDSSDSSSLEESKEVSIVIQDAEMWLKTATMADEANVFREFDVTGHLRHDGESRLLMISPGRLLDHSPVSTALCDGLLKYLVPVLAEATWVHGELSLDLSECEIDLDRPEASRISGTLHIHGIQAGVKNAMIAAASNRIAHLLGGEGSDTIHLADNAIVSFEMHDGAIWHDGVEFGLPRISPDFVVRTSGSVSFADALDLQIKVPLAAHFLRDGPLADAIKNKTLVLNATGTFEKPKVTLDDESLFADLITSVGANAGEGDLTVKRLVEGIRGAIRGQEPSNGSANAVNSDSKESAKGQPTEGQSTEDQSTEDQPTEDRPIETPILDELRDRLRDRRRARGGLFRRRSQSKTPVESPVESP